MINETTKLVSNILEDYFNLSFENLMNKYN